MKMDSIAEIMKMYSDDAIDLSTAVHLICERGDSGDIENEPKARKEDLENFMRRRGLNQVGMAALVGVNQKTISRWLQGDTIALNSSCHIFEVDEIKRLELVRGVQHSIKTAATQPNLRENKMPVDPKHTVLRTSLSQEHDESVIAHPNAKQTGLALKDVRTGADLKLWREGLGITQEQLANAINRALACVRRWEDNGKESLTIDVIMSLQNNFNDRGELNGQSRDINSPYLGDDVRENFMDEKGEKRQLLFNLKKYFNETVRNEYKAIDRIVFTGAAGIAQQYAAGAIWMASDEARKDRKVEDWLLRRIITKFHEKPPAESAYRYFDSETNRTVSVIAQDIVDEDGESTGYCVVGVSLDVPVDHNALVTMNAAKKEAKKYIANVNAL